MFKLMVLLLSSFASIDSANVSKECQSLFEANDPTDCWKAPQYGLKASEKCDTGCKTGKCCFSDCMKSTGYIIEKPEKEKFLKVYEDFNENLSLLKESWMPVISKSYDFCESLLSKIDGTTAGCKLPAYFIPMIECIKQQNFLNCPKELFKSSERCEAIKKFVVDQETCGTKYGSTFLIGNLFFELENERLKDCEKLFKQNKPSKCARIPNSLMTKKTSDDCKEQCKENTSKCCLLKCQTDASGILLGEEIQKDKFIESFKNFFLGKNETVFETWLPVIEKAFDVCNPLVSEVKTSTWCNLPDKAFEITNCMKQEMLLNVPTTLMLDAAECEKVQSFVKSQTTCGKKYGEVFVIDLEFWHE